MRTALLCALLAGCNHLPTVKVPVATPCVQLEQIPEAPAVRSREALLAMNRYHRTIAVWEERLTVIDYADVLRSMLLECAR